MYSQIQLRAKAELERRRRGKGQPSEPQWPEQHVLGPDEATPVPFHLGQTWAWDSERRFVAMLAGTQGGKTGFGPWWLHREIYGPEVGRGAGDYLAVTATFDLFKLKMLPALQRVFCDILGVGRYWAGDRVIELRDPNTGRFLARKSTDLMWGRVILRSADSPGGLESGTVKGAWLDEAGQPRFTVGSWRGVRRRLALHQGRVLITTTLYDLGWVKATFIDKAERDGAKTVEVLDGGAEVERTDSASENTALIQFDSIANPTYPLTEYEEAQATMPDDEFQMFWRGRAARLRYLVYDCFDPERDTCPRFPIPTNWERYLGIDPGGVNTAAMFYASKPGSRTLYCYREYLAGGKTAKEHVEDILVGEPGIPFAVGGSKSEHQWRREFIDAGLPIKPPPISDVGLGINRVYGCHKRHEIIYFDDLPGVLSEKASYRRKRDKEGNVTDEIEDKSSFHRLDAERYIIAKIRGRGWGEPEVEELPTYTPRGATPSRAQAEAEKQELEQSDVQHPARSAVRRRIRL